MRSVAELRVAHAHELPDIASTWLAMFEEAGKHRESEFAPGWRERFIAHFSERIERGDARYFVAVEDGHIIGTAGAFFTEAYPAAIHGLRSGYIFGVYVHPNHRGQGLARALTNLAIDFLRAGNPWAIRLHASNAGRPIYEQLGFVPTNEMELPRSI
ncbi:MAG TPA: GNAT family N-acetyltransferase [Candidatus Aquilonibacter sp.]